MKRTEPADEDRSPLDRGRVPELPALQGDDSQERRVLSHVPPHAAGEALSFEPRSTLTACPLLVEGTLQNAGGGDPLEYQVLMEVRDDTGKLLSRQIIGVGALHASEKRVFSVRVEMSSANHVN